VCRVCSCVRHGSSGAEKWTSVSPCLLNHRLGGGLGRSLLHGPGRRNLLGRCSLGRSGLAEKTADALLNGRLDGRLDRRFLREDGVDREGGHDARWEDRGGVFGGVCAVNSAPMRATVGFVVQTLEDKTNAGLPLVEISVRDFFILSRSVTQEL